MAAILGRAHALLHKTLNPTTPLRAAISTFPYLSQEPQLQETPSSSATAAAPLPPNPSTGSPFYQENWRVPNPSPGLAIGGQSLVPMGGSAATRMMAFSQTLDVASLMNVFADWMTSQRWSDLKQLFEFWIRSLDATGKPNKPDVHLYNHYLRANLMMGATAGELLDLVAQMQEYQIAPNTASYNLVLKAMYQARESEAAEKLVDRMLQTGTLPDDESYNLVIGLLILMNQVDSALKYLDLTLKSGYMLSSSVFSDCVRSCVNSGRLDMLSSIIEKCKTTDQNKALCPSWNLCNYIADVALQADHSKLAYFSLEFLARWIARGENARPPVLLSVDEGLVVSALGTVGRTYDSTLLDAAWSILRRSLRQKRAPNPEAYLARIFAHASLGNLQRAFSTLNEFENVYGNSGEVDRELFSPFTSLYPLVVACCKNGFSTLDSVYIQLENLSRADPPYKSVAALNCVILGCANIWDLDRAYETFEAVTEKIGLAPDIHSYNALMSAFGKLKKTAEASKVFEHLVSLGVKPNATTYSLLVDAHLINRDPKAALAVIDEMVEAGFTPSKEMLKKVRRRCSRESDFDSDERVRSLAQKFKIRMGGEFRREMLYNLEYSADY
ncbi:pentatricopeptide repeat-containing protein At1g26460, mitochondrial [Phoenix dactylifera]|uniref:Pentatricopeptide repeat-containing protein At1g26460, mitochondrial n=1 Tax=Phoenix dactylifera TaxID=42345 RepID=A0A8B9AA53_PHODC|nr:pentatricopeptide repeat-containing protein At1g26460, mitochondrial [Phoenix dactylifera]XP_038983465.1 pentatricopeptide repeat-containing protein At1g26460, mitochondrial [Phoenix dactylifera]